MREILFAGFGGQGILTAGLVMSQIALHIGNKATWLPAYGAAMRGGTANCTVKYGEEFITNPGTQKPDLLLAMNEPSLEKFSDIVKPGGFVLVNDDMVECDVSPRDGVTVAKVKCMDIARKLGLKTGANIVMVGAMVSLLDDFSRDDAIAGMNDMFRKKGKSKFEAGNVAAFNAGYDAARL